MSAKKTSISVRVAAAAIGTTLGGTTSQTIFHLNPKAFDELCLQLSAEPKATYRLRKLLTKRAPWDGLNEA